MIIIGLMSGTSADGIDIAVCDINGKPGNMTATIIAAETYLYERDIRQRILDCCDPQSSHVDKIAQLHVDLAEIFASCIHQLLESSGNTTRDIDLVASHGQTLWHNVLENGSVSASLQITEASVIAERTGITTISNFRARDIAAGGQGAPLTGYVDWLLLRHPVKWRAIQNIGGMGNVTFLPPLNTDHTMPIAFDTGPGNALLDTAVAHFTNGNKTYDKDGILAKQGRIDEEWLDEMLRHPYYERSFPKTTGRELFGTQAAMQLIDEGKQRSLGDTEIIATLTALTATNIADAYKRFAPAQVHEVILGGGGQHNPVMRGLLTELLAPAVVRTHEDIGMNSDFKEALVFAVLAYETWHGRPGTLPSLTGAQHARILGQITPGSNFMNLMRQTLTG